jgi:hypothetical protein
MLSHFDIYLVKESSGIDTLINSAKNPGEVKAVQEASAAKGTKLSKSQAAGLIALGIGVGVTGALVYKQSKDKRRVHKP